MMYIKPCKGYLTSLFSNSRKNPVLGVIRPHQGVDFSGDPDNTIVAAANGTVRVADNAGKTGFGKYIVITHPNGQETVYAHLSSISVSINQKVSQAQKIGVKGTTGSSTGIHLHFEISKGRWTNDFSNKIDPLLHFFDPVTKDIQEMLNKIGHRLIADGIYGDATISAVSDYQKKNGLVADGVCGRGTYDHLSKATAPLSSATSNVSTTNTEDTTMKFTSPTLQRETEFSLQSKARREIVVNTAIAGGANAIWLEKLQNGTITDGDLLGLCMKYIVDNNK